MNKELSPSEHIDQVHAKITRLLKQYKQLEKDNERLKAELAKKNETDEMIGQKNRQLERQLNMMKATAGNGDDTAKKELEKQLNFYIREIDKCIAILGQ
jgi:septal ring factor EnvC (AmiA/AmiB activator)